MKHIINEINRFLLIQYPCCQTNDIGLTEYWIKQYPIFLLFRLKKKSLNTNMYSYYYEVGRYVSKCTKLEFISHTTDHQHIARMQSEIYLVDMFRPKTVVIRTDLLYDLSFTCVYRPY
jgi:hypothetical protein